MVGGKIDWDGLFARAWEAQKNGYAPYSGFQVGAAAGTGTGKIFCGCNVENASFGLTLCAERVAIATAVQAGFRNFVAIAIVSESDEPTPPCGACRQVLVEFNPEIVVRSAARSGVLKEWSLVQLLPSPFTYPQELKGSTWNNSS